MPAVDLIILIPLAAALVALGLGDLRQTAPRVVALASGSAQLGAFVVATRGGLAEAPVTGVDVGAGALVWSVALDGLTAPFVLLTIAIGLAAAVGSWGVSRRPGAHFALLLGIQAGICAVFLADSLLLFYVGWESVLLPMFLLIGGWGSVDARRAAMKFLVFTFAGGLVLLAGVIVSILGTGTTSIRAITEAGGAGVPPSLVFWLLAFGMLVKVPVVPVHTWLPDAHTEAPTAGSILLAGVLLKMGGYGLIRIAIPFAPVGYADARVVLATFGFVGIVWGAATALVQTDLKRLVAYSSVAHMGFVVLAVSIGTPLALSAAVLTMVSHGLVSGMLFYLVGALYERAHTREIARFGGLAARAPRWSAAFVFACLASAGLPGLSGFPGEFATAIEAFERYGWWTAVLGVGVVLAATYNLAAVRGTVRGPAGDASDVSDLGLRETVAAALFGLAILSLGVAPWLVTQGLTPTLRSLAGAFGLGV